MIIKKKFVKKIKNEEKIEDIIILFNYKYIFNILTLIRILIIMKFSSYKILY